MSIREVDPEGFTSRSGGPRVSVPLGDSEVLGETLVDVFTAVEMNRHRPFDDYLALVAPRSQH